MGPLRHGGIGPIHISTMNQLCRCVFSIPLLATHFIYNQSIYPVLVGSAWSSFARVHTSRYEFTSLWYSGTAKVSDHPSHRLVYTALPETVSHDIDESKPRIYLFYIQSSQVSRIIGNQQFFWLEFGDTGGHLELFIAGRILCKQELVGNFCGATV
jgi:hypothetical protein